MARQQASHSLTSESFRRFNHSVDADIGDKLGNHSYQENGHEVTQFNVWAPEAKEIFLVGDFNQWTPERTPLRPDPATGVWTGLVEGIPAGDRYQYLITDRTGIRQRKSDPYACRYAPLPDHCSLTGNGLQHQWNDKQWISERPRKDWNKEPLSIYELHLGSWFRPDKSRRGPLNYRTIAPRLVAYLKRLHFTHVLFMPLMEHPYTGSWGYQVTGFFAPTSRFGTPEDLAILIDTLHQHGIGALFDWVPAHFPKDDFALANFDGGPLYEYACPEQGHHPEWGTAIFDYSKPQVVSFLVSSALTWIGRFHFDGIRVDAVASMLYRDYSRASGAWTPNLRGGIENIEAVQFIKTLNHEIGTTFPGVLRIAEESTAWPGVTQAIDHGGLGFDLKWNLGWMHDTLTYFSQETCERHYHQQTLALPSSYQHTENYCLPLSHDEVVHEKGSLLSKMPGGSPIEKARHLRALYAWMWAWPGKKLLFMGGELGQLEEWDHDGELPWAIERNQPHRGIQSLISELNRAYLTHPTLGMTDDQADAFQWCHLPHPPATEEDLFAFARFDSKGRAIMLCVGNFSSRDHKNFRITVPFAENWSLCLNSSAYPFQGGPQSSSSPRNAAIISEETHGTQLTIQLPAATTLHLSPRVSPEDK